jgi:DNA ligase D
MLPLLAQRPLTLVRCPQGIEGPRFYQKHATASVPASVGRVAVRPDEAPYAMVTDLRSLIALVQIAVLELHPWGARADRLDRPDLLIFDLDPDPSLPWRRTAELACVFRDYLLALGLVPFARTTGGKGLHVVVPLQRRCGWAELKAFAQGVAQQFVRHAPEQLTTRMPKRMRRDKILIDVLRNDADATAIASYSARALPGAPVAMPLDWEELRSPRRRRRSLGGLRGLAPRADREDARTAAGRRLIRSPRLDRRISALAGARAEAEPDSYGCGPQCRASPPARTAPRATRRRGRSDPMGSGPSQDPTQSGPSPGAVGVQRIHASWTAGS